MYDVYNRGEVFYEYAFSSKKKYLIGNRETFIRTSINPKYKLKKNAYVGNANAYVFSGKVGMNPNDCYYEIKKEYYCNECNGRIYQGLNIIPILHQIESCYMDGLGRRLDPRDYLDEMIAYRLATPVKPVTYYLYPDERWMEYSRKRPQYPKSHTTHCWRKPKSRSPVKYLREKSLLLSDPDVKEYLQYNIFKRNQRFKEDPYILWDPAVRRVEGNWKSQSKSSRQYNKHTKRGNSDSLRMMNVYDFCCSEEEIDEMLEADFYAGLSA